MIHAFINDFKDDWNLLILLLEFAYNTSESSVTNYTPFFLFYGRHPVLPIEALYNTAYHPVTTAHEYVKTLQTQQNIVFAWVKDQKQKAANFYKDHYDETHHTMIKMLNLGDFVLLAKDDKDSSIGKKYRPLFY